MKRILSILSILLVVSYWQASAQDKQLTIDDAILAYYKGLYPRQMSVTWLPDSKAFSFFDRGKQALFLTDVKTNTTKELLNLKELNRALAEQGCQPTYYLMDYRWKTETLFEFTHGSDIVLYDTQQQKVAGLTRLPKDAENITKAPNGLVAFTKANNLFVFENEKETAVSDEKNTEIEYGQTVHRNEFGINGGIFWSPNGKYLAYYRNDQTPVSDYPIVDVTTRVASLKNEKYPMAGMANEKVTLHIYDVAKETSIQIETDTSKDQFLTNIAWSPNSESVFIAVLNREQNHMQLKQFSAKDGGFQKILFEEKHDKWVEPEHPVQFLKTKPNQFLWQSERDGYNHVYLYDTRGKQLKQLTKGKWIVTKVIGTDANERKLYVMSTAKSPLERHLMEIDMRSGRSKILTSESGMHTVKMSPNNKLFIDSYSALDVPNIVALKTIKGKTLNTLLKAENPLEGYNVGEVELFTMKAADGKTDLHGRIVKPIDFDPKKKYPMVVYVYGGPHAQLVQNGWLGSVRYWQLYMAQKGYVCMTVDNRGSANRGFAFENVMHRKMGEEEMKDQMKAVEFMKAKGYIDEDRIGVHGWSYGGFMTTSLMVNYPETFKVGVAGGPVIDWKFYEIMYGERYMDTPQENPDGYAKSSLLSRAKDLKGKLLLIHGAIDPVVVWQHSLTFVRECIKNNVQVDYFTYPTHEHNVRGRDRVHLMDKVSIYFDDFLK